MTGPSSERTADAEMATTTVFNVVPTRGWRRIFRRSKTVTRFNDCRITGVATSVSAPSNPGIHDAGLTRWEIWLPVIVGLAVLLALAAWEVFR